jgi:hypothetical protein
MLGLAVGAVLWPMTAAAGEVTSLPQFSDVRPSDWAYQALVDLVTRYGCVAGEPDGRWAGGRNLSRFEAAALLGACLDRVTEQTDALRRLLEDFQGELALVRGRLGALDLRIGSFEAQRFSPTTKVNGLATFVVGSNAFSGRNRPLVAQARSLEGGTTFNYDLRLTFDTSFSGKDLLRTQLRAGNFADSAFGNGAGLNQLEVAFEEGCGNGRDCGDVVSIYRLYYQVPLNDTITLSLGGRVRQDDMLAMWPSVYPSETILDVFTYTGAPGTYNTNLGAGAGLWWKQNGWSLSAEYIAYNGDISLGSDQAGETGTLQLGYVGRGGGWGAALAYNYSNGLPGGVYPGSATPLAALDTAADPDLEAFGLDGTTNSIGLAAYWQPARSGWIPSVSAGWGLNSINPGRGVSGFDRLTSQSWSAGLQWNNALVKGNTAGMAFGQPTFLTSCGHSCERLLGPGQKNPRDGLFAWEWWYRFQLSDAMSVTPALFYLSNPLGQINSVIGERAGISNPSFNNLGVLVKTSFRF